MLSLSTCEPHLGCSMPVSSISWRLLSLHVEHAMPSNIHFLSSLLLLPSIFSCYQIFFCRSRAQWPYWSLQHQPPIVTDFLEDWLVLSPWNPKRLVFLSIIVLSMYFQVLSFLYSHSYPWLTAGKGIDGLISVDVFCFLICKLVIAFTILLYTELPWRFRHAYYFHLFAMKHGTGCHDLFFECWKWMLFQFFFHYAKKFFASSCFLLS